MPRGYSRIDEGSSTAARLEDCLSLSLAFAPAKFALEVPLPLSPVPVLEERHRLMVPIEVVPVLARESDRLVDPELRSGSSVLRKDLLWGTAQGDAGLPVFS